MSSAYAKQKLKQSREAIQKKDWQAAAEAAADVLESEKDNYNANVFRGLALLNLKKYDESEAAYRAAIDAQPSQMLAWQGLEKFYTERKQWDKAANTIRSELDILLKADDATKCAEALQRLLALQREEGSRSELATALSLLLLSSPYYSLFSSLPVPDQTAPTSTSTFEVQMAVHVRSLEVIEEIISLRERVESDAVEKEVEKRRNRLDSAGKGKEVIRNEVGVEIWGSSLLPDLYDQILSHPSASDELRRDAESKLLRHRYKLLLALPNPDARLNGPAGTAATSVDAAKNKAEADAAAGERKRKLRDMVAELVRGMVLIGVPDELAWNLRLDWMDVESLVDYPRNELRAFIHIFPRAGRTKSVRTILRAVADEQFLIEEQEALKERDVEIEEPDLLNLAIDGLEAATDSVLAHRVASTLYLLDRDYSSASDVASAGLVLARRHEVEAATDLSRTRQSLDGTLATALTHLHPPQHHARAQRLADGVLARSPDDIEALLAKAYIDEAAHRWEEARALFVRVQQTVTTAEPGARTDAFRAVSLSHDPLREAQSEIAWCDVCMGKLEEGRQELEELIKLIDPIQNEGVSAEERATAWWRLGKCLWEMDGESRSDPAKAFTCFVTALKRYPAYAPAFTSLGLFYDWVADPPDALRASKCFQKAFELDAREHEAARRLAEGFADEREWDLVEVVARRTVEGEGGADALGGVAASQRRHMSRNAWAWKAIGAVELHRHKYEAAINAFQIALRASPDEASTWQRLGEAYAASGRHVAALKTFAKARVLAPGEWQIEYSTADLQRQLGEFDEAVTGFERILSDRPDELGVRVALAETRLMQGRGEYATGYVARAEHSYARALADSLVALQDDLHLRSGWKIVADACYELTKFGTLKDLEHILSSAVTPLLDLTQPEEVDAKLPSVSVVTLECARAALSAPEERPLLLASIFFYKLRVLLNAADDNVAGSAWADLATALYAFGRSASDAVQTSEESERNRLSLRQAIGCIKQALKHEPGNENFWLALGNLTFGHGVKLAQHSYIRAIENSPRNPIPWTNLGFLYLQADDVELANEAFIRAQTLDPEWAQAWVGQAFVAQAHGDEVSARVLFEHGFQLSGGSVLEADYGFASSVFASFASQTSRNSVQLHSPAFALSCYLAHSPQDSTALHLSALFCERLDQRALAISRIEQAASLLEAEYEKSEDAVTATKYAVAEANLARIRLANDDAEGAAEAFQATLGLLEAGESNSDADELLPASVKANVRLHAHFGTGLALYWTGDYAGALEAFETALAEIAETGVETESNADVRAHVAVLLAQVLWTMGSEEQREAAKSQLLDSISSVSHCLPAITALAAIGIVSSDESLVDAALSEIREMPSDRVRELDPNGDVEFLVSMHHYSKGNTAGALSVLASAVRHSPTATRPRLALAEALIRESIRTASAGADEGTARAAAKTALQAIDLVKARAAEEGEEHLQHAVRLAAIAGKLAPGITVDVPQSDGAGAEEAGASREQNVGSEETSSEGQQKMDAKSLAQRAVRAAPWEMANWRALAMASEGQAA